MIDRKSQSFPYRSYCGHFTLVPAPAPANDSDGSWTACDSVNLARTDQEIKNVPALNRPAYIRVLADRSCFPISCARACTVASEVYTEAQSFADCKLHIRTRLLAPAFSNFWKNPPLNYYFLFCLIPGDGAGRLRLREPVVLDV
jgi:hypothetical protein